MKGTIRIDVRYLNEAGEQEWLAGSDISADDLKPGLADLDAFMSHEHGFTLAEGFE